MALLTLRYDLRVPPDLATAAPVDYYGACLDQCAWADDRGFDAVVLSEHHGIDDGFLPSPLVMAAAIAGRTRRIGITVSAVLLPLHDPLRLAEDVAVLDLASGGRVSIVAGLGYRPEEFEMFGVDRRQRGVLAEEYVEVLRKAWTGEPFEHRGRTVQVTPRPHTRPHPLVLAGGSTDLAARRAARLRLPFLPAVGDPELAAAYEQECVREAYEEGFVILPHRLGFVHVTDDPDRAWEQIGPHALYDARTYAGWQTPGQRSAVHVDASSVDDLRESGVYRVVTPEECLALADELGPTGALVFHPLLAGLAPEIGWAGLELFAAAVLPRLRPDVVGSAR